MRKLLAAVALLGMLLAPAAAQAQLVAGPMAGFHDDADFGIGGFMSIPIPSVDPNLSIDPSFVLYFPDGPVDYLEFNGDVVYRFEVSADTPVLPFAMGGINIARISVDGFGSQTEMGLNLGGGIGFRAESLRPFVGAKFELEGGEGFVVFGGVGFQLGN